MEAQGHWRAALGQLQLEMPRATFDTWVRDATLLAYEDNTFIIGVHNAYARDWLEDRLRAKVKQVLAGIVGRTVDVRFVVAPPDPAPADPVPLWVSEAPTGPQTNGHRNGRLNARYTFETFVVGPSNRLAHAAAQAVAESPATVYNPLFLYGGVGLGKTHLLHAIGHACQGKGLRVLYVSSEEFTNDLVNAIRRHTTEAFRERYRQTEVLLIDDIQFIAGKESTQEEFFHTFNTLHGQDKQIVISSDRPPKAMMTLEERLRSRFEWGLCVDIQPPDFETRLAILRSKAERAGWALPPEYLERIARRVQSNIRELEGALTRVLAFAELRGQRVDETVLEMALADFLPRHNQVSHEQVLALVARHYGVEEARLLGRERRREVALPRQVAMYLLREETGASLPQIGEWLGGRDHTTVMYGCEKVAERLEIDEAFRREVMSLRESLYRQVGVPV